MRCLPNRAQSIAIIGLLTAIVTLEQFRIKRLQESAALESVRAVWVAASSVYQVEGSGEAKAMQRVLDNLHCIFVLADANGAPLQSSTLYREIGAPFPPAPATKPRLWKYKAAPNPLRSARYVFLTGVIHDRDAKVY